MAIDVLVKDVHKVYSARKTPPVHALNGINAHFGSGSLTTITGVSGCGKSTLLSLIGLMDVPTGGRIILGDKDAAQMSELQKAGFRNVHIGVVMQDFALINTLSVNENIEIPLLIGSKLNAKKRREEVQSALQQAGITGLAGKMVSRLSGGKKQRVAIARALVRHPQLILADEPTAALDSENTKSIMRLFMELQHQDTTFIICTHDPLVSEKGDSVYHMIDGVFVQ